MILMSACLLGIRCRYDNKILKLNRNHKRTINNLIKHNILIPVCPEQLGGLPTPRSPATVKNNKVINIKGVDVTTNFRRGAAQVLKLAKLYKVKTAYLKNHSPSCGKNGVTTQILKKLRIHTHFI
jgi:uncharacterized protein YbbK (DUF523 family)